jgi:hypothetical protein
MFLEVEHLISNDGSFAQKRILATLKALLTPVYLLLCL